METAVGLRLGKIVVVAEIWISAQQRNTEFGSVLEGDFTNLTFQLDTTLSFLWRKISIEIFRKRY